jgi:MFS family permease
VELDGPAVQGQVEAPQPGEVYRDLNLLLFAGAFISNILVANLQSKKIMQLIYLANGIFVAGFCMYFSTSRIHLYAGRFITGLAVGSIANTIPCSLSFIAPVRYRGAITSVYGIAIIAGIIFGYILCLYGVTLSFFAFLMIVLSTLQCVLLRFSQRLDSI